MVWADTGDWESRWELERNSFFPCKIKYCQLERQSVHGGKYLWEGWGWAQRCWAWSEQSVKRIISFPWCPANGDKDSSFINARTTSQKRHPLLLPSANSWQIFHFLLFIVFTKSPYSWWSRCKWKVKACDTENHVSLSAKRCDKAFPSFNMHKGSGRAISRALGPGVLQGFPGKCGEATWGCWAFRQHQSFCVSWRNAVDALEFNLINADNTVSLTYHKRAEVAHLNSLISCFSSCPLFVLGREWKPWISLYALAHPCCYHSPWAWYLCWWPPVLRQCLFTPSYSAGNGPLCVCLGYKNMKNCWS